MTSYFKKLDVVLPEIDMSRITGGPLVEGFPDFRTWKIRDLDYFNNLLSSILKFKVLPDSITYNEITGGGTSPHSEHFLIQTVLNFYIEPGECVTFFWKLKDLNIELEFLPRLNASGNWNKSVVKTYSTDSLECEASFIANASDAYILGVDQIHSVSKPITDDVRKFIRLGWMGYNVEEIFNSIEVL
jgi:hypothetical protein